MYGGGEGAFHSLLQWEFSFAPLRMLSCFPSFSIVKKSSLGSLEHFKKFLLNSFFNLTIVDLRCCIRFRCIVMWNQL